MDDVKNWLDSVDIPMSEGPVNLNWGPIMKHINESPYEFFQQGGWSFLGGARGIESEHSEASDSESEFEAGSPSFESSASSNDGSDYGASDASVGASESDYSGEDSDDGEDWDELERKAAKADQRRADGKKMRGSDDSDDDKPKKKSATKANPKANGKSKR